MSSEQGQTVLITGASSGIGLATALYMAERGYSVIGTSRSAERLGVLQEEAVNRSLPVTAVELDINEDEAVDEVLPRLIAEHAGIDALVNNAGYGLWGPVESLSMAEMKSQFETNFFAPARLILKVLPGMVQRGRGTIVNISSVLGRIATPFNGAYAASKFALEGMSEALRLELWPLGVRVALVEPGLVSTNFVKNLVMGEMAESRELPYFSYVERYRRKRRRYDRLKRDPVNVARVVHKIVKSRRPRFRYVVGTEARLGILGARVLPERLFQALVSRATMR